MKKIHVLLGQIDDVIAQEKSSESNEEIEFTPAMLTEMAGGTASCTGTGSRTFHERGKE